MPVVVVVEVAQVVEHWLGSLKVLGLKSTCLVVQLKQSALDPRIASFCHFFKILMIEIKK